MENNLRDLLQKEEETRETISSLALSEFDFLFSFYSEETQTIIETSSDTLTESETHLDTESETKTLSSTKTDSLSLSLLLDKLTIEDYWQHDGHFNASGAEKTAKIILDNLGKN